MTVWVSAKTRRTARVATVCYWCREPIKPERQYIQWCGKSCGEFWIVKVHPECHAAWQSLPSGEQEIECGEFARGCTCERDRCKCGSGSETQQ